MKNIKKIIIFLIFILIILVGTILCIRLNPINREIAYIYDEKNEGKISYMPQNITYFFSYYKGEINPRSLYKALDIYVNKKIEKYCKEIINIKQKGIEQYYKENSKKIYKELGIEDQNQFESFISEIKKLNGNDLNLESYTFYPEKAKKNTDYIEGILLIEFYNNEKIAFYTRASNLKNTERTPITLLGNIDEKYYEYEYETTVTENNIEIDFSGKVID